MRSLLDLGKTARRGFASIYVAGMLSVVAAGMAEPDRVFGFQMFNESSTLTISLERRVRRNGRSRLEPMPGGEWQARDRSGRLHTFRWSDRVRDRALGRLDQRVRATYGVDGQLFRLRKALADVLANIPEDAETQALVAVVEASRNGRAPERIRLTAVRR